MPLEEVTTLQELVQLARRRLAQGAWDYLQGGTETETGLARNRLAIERLALRPRVCVDVRRVEPATELLGRRIRLPVFLAPIGSIETFHPSGGAGAAEAAARFGVPLMLSSVCAPGLEAVADAAPEGFRIFQLYVRGDEEWIDQIVARGHDRETVHRIEHLLYIAEYKRRQAAPGVKITRKNFGRDRRYPITNRFRDRGK